MAVLELSWCMRRSWFFWSLVAATAPTGLFCQGQDRGDPRQAGVSALIDKLVEIEEGDIGYMPTMSGSRFLPLGLSQPGAMLLGQSAPAISPTLRELVALGQPAVPQLLAHLDDQRPTRIKLEHGGLLGGMFLASEYDYNRRTAKQLPLGVNTNYLKTERVVERYAVTVGDLCFVALGQIVNRDFHAVRYQPTSIIVVNSPGVSPELRVAAKKEWGQLAAEQHRNSLTLDVLEPDHEDRRLGACVRLGYYYPDALEPLAAKQLSAPRYDGDAGSTLINELYRADEAGQRQRMFDAFTKQHGEVGRQGVLVDLFLDLRLQEADERGALSPPLAEKRPARTCLVELYGYPETVKSDDQPSLFVDGDASQARLVDVLAHFPSPKIDQAVRSILHATDDDYLASACARYLVGRGADQDIARYVDQRLETAVGRRLEELQRFQDRLGWTPLHVAAEVSEEERVAALVLQGADVNARAANGQTPLHVAADHGSYGALRTLLDLKADPNVADAQGRTPLQLGLSYDTAAEILLEGGAKPNEILGAAFAGRADLVAEFLKQDRTAVHARQLDGETPLHLAAGRGHVEVAKVLLAAGAEVNATSGSEFTPLHLAAGYDGPEMVALLLEHKADRNAKSWDHRTPLDWARDNRNGPVIPLLEQR